MAFWVDLKLPTLLRGTMQARGQSEYSPVISILSESFVSYSQREDVTCNRRLLVAH